MQENNDTVIVCGNGINAHTILHSLKRLSWPGRTVLLWHEEEGPGLAGLLNRTVDRFPVTMQDAFELPRLLESCYGGRGNVYVLFTDERWHTAFHTYQQKNSGTALRFHLGSKTHLNTILDRYTFCSFIDEHNLGAVPATIHGHEDPLEAFGPEFIVRPRYSWRGASQRERVKLVSNENEFHAAIKDYASRGLERGDLAFQEKLSIRNQDNVSVCGWYGPSEKHLYCTRKVLQYPPKTGGGDLVELMGAPPGVMQQAEALLKAFEYDGPFELEFVFDEKAGRFKVIELNPRFWLQHGLIDRVSGYALVSRSLGREPLIPAENDKRLKYWVNPLYSFSRACKGEFQSIRCWRSDRTYSPLTCMDATKYAANYAMRTIKA